MTFRGQSISVSWIPGTCSEKRWRTFAQRCGRRLLTRPVAFLLAGEMLVALLQVHLPRGGAPIQNGGELPLLFMLVFLFLVGHGAGPASLDARRRMP